MPSTWIEPRRTKQGVRRYVISLFALKMPQVKIRRIAMNKSTREALLKAKKALGAIYPHVCHDGMGECIAIEKDAVMEALDAIRALHL